MFGDLIFSTIPFSTVDDTPLENDNNYWNKLCPAKTDWDTIDKDVKSSNECDKG